MEYLKSISIEFIAAFLGFLFALLLDKMLEKRNRKEKTKLVLENIISELKDICSGLNSYIENNRSVSFRIQIPSWEALQYSGMTIELIEHSFYQDLITCYSLIQNYNDALLFRDNKSLSVDELKNITGLINKLLNEIEGEAK